MCKSPGGAGSVSEIHKDNNREGKQQGGEHNEKIAVPAGLFQTDFLPSDFPIFLSCFESDI
jgi:hypothetical protein